MLSAVVEQSDGFKMVRTDARLRICYIFLDYSMCEVPWLDMCGGCFSLLKVSIGIFLFVCACVCVRVLVPFLFVYFSRLVCECVCLYVLTFVLFFLLVL